MVSIRDREVACSASDRQGSNFASCVWRTVSSHSSHHPPEVLLTQFSLCLHKRGIKLHSFHFHVPRHHGRPRWLIPFRRVSRIWVRIPALGPNHSQSAYLSSWLYFMQTFLIIHPPHLFTPTPLSIPHLTTYPICSSLHDITDGKAFLVPSSNLIHYTSDIPVTRSFSTWSTFSCRFSNIDDVHTLYKCWVKLIHYKSMQHNIFVYLCFLLYIARMKKQIFPVI